MSQMKYFTTSVSSATTSDWLELDTTNAGSNYNVLLTISDTATASVEVKLASNGTVVKLSDFTDKTATTMAAVVGPFSHIRINCSSYTSGTVTLEALQGC